MPKLRWWWCGNSQEDGGCDCVAPTIYSDDGKEIEQGPFTSPTYEATQDERDEQEVWAKDACARHGCEYFPAIEQFARDTRKPKP